MNYRDFEQPLFGMCANIEVTPLYEATKRLHCSFTAAVIYLISEATNAIPQFRQRIRGNQVVDHKVVHPFTTLLLENDLFTFCRMAFKEPFAAFTEEAGQSVAYAMQHPSLQD